SAAAGQSGRLYVVTFDPSLGDVRQMTVANVGITAAPTVAYLAQLRNETVAATTLNAGTGEAADVTLAAGTALNLNADSTLAAQLTTVANNNNRVRDAATVTLSGGTLYFKGNAATASTETLGALILTANTASILRSDFGGVPGQSLTFTASAGAIVTRNTGATLNL